MKKRLSARKSNRAFQAAHRKKKAINVTPMIMRGGIRL